MERDTRYTQHSDDVFLGVMRMIKQDKHSQEIMREYPSVPRATIARWRAKYANLPDEKLPLFCDRYMRPMVKARFQKKED
jgi:hypothetical protein